MSKSQQPANAPETHQNRIAVSTQNPKAIRIEMMWKEMREAVISNFPKSPGIIEDAAAYLKFIEDVYKSDAYHSLSIEGYMVNPELIEKVRSGQWDPEQNESDDKERNALAARGYYLTFEKVKSGIERVIKGHSAAEIAKKEHNDWFRQFVRSVSSSWNHQRRNSSRISSIASVHFCVTPRASIVIKMSAS